MYTVWKWLSPLNIGVEIILFVTSYALISLLPLYADHPPGDGLIPQAQGSTIGAYKVHKRHKWECQGHIGTLSQWNKEDYWQRWASIIHKHNWVSATYQCPNNTVQDELSWEACNVHPNHADQAQLLSQWLFENVAQGQYALQHGHATVLLATYAVHEWQKPWWWSESQTFCSMQPSNGWGEKCFLPLFKTGWPSTSSQFMYHLLTMYTWSWTSCPPWLIWS